MMRLHFGQLSSNIKGNLKCTYRPPAHPAPCTEYEYMCCVDYFYNYVGVSTGSSVVVYM